VRPGRVALAVAVVVAVAAGGATAVTALGHRSSTRTGYAAMGALDGASPAAAPTTPATAPTSARPVDCGAWGCAMKARMRRAAAMLAARPGYLGMVVRDRRTGAVWRAGSPDRRIWAGSTPKLALATSLLERARAGSITLDATARGQIAAMLAVSDNDAADALWDRYGGSSQIGRFQTVYGMRSTGFVSGFPQRWGFIKSTAADLAALMSYILDRLNPDDRAYLVGAMRTVGPIQHWGVWAAGPSQRPGVKDGWSIEQDAGVKHWITATVGFAGPDERYVVSAMYHLPAGTGTIDAGTHTVSDLVATVFGARVPAPITVPDPSTGY
jgi:beta-lactamase class A